VTGELRQRLPAEARAAGAEHDDVVEAAAELVGDGAQLGEIVAPRRQAQQRQAAVLAPAAQRAERRRRAAAETPIYAKWWFWTAMAASAIATGVGIGYAVPKQHAIDCAQGGCP